MKQVRFFLSLLFFIYFLFSQATNALELEVVKVGLLMDYSGKTRDVARSYLRGITDYFNYYNETQGKRVQKKIEVIVRDTKYDPEIALKHYEEMKKKGVKIIHAWGTASCLKIKDRASKDKIIVFTASYDESLATPKSSPYTFFMGASYTDQAIIALKYIQSQKKKARVGIIYNTTSFGRSPFFNKRFQSALKKMELELGAEIVVELGANSAMEQIEALKEKNIDFAIIQETTKATVAILQAANKMNLRTQLIGLNWAFNENIMGLVHKASEGYMGLPLFPQGDQGNLKGIRELRNYIQKIRGEVGRIPSKYIAAWATGMVMARGIEKAPRAHEGLDYLKAFESIRNFETMGLTEPISFSRKSHSALRGTQIYTIRNKRIVPVNNKVYTID